MDSKEKFYITTSIAYVNGAPHIGYALELVQADTIARYMRARGKEVYFLTGTDEHGAKILRAAEASGKDVKLFVDENAEKFKELAMKLNISNDDFIRTSAQKRHWPAAQAMWNKLEEAGDIYKGNYKGLYCVGCEAFITEKDLVDGKCADHGKEPEIIEEENYFFRLSKYSDEIKSKIENNELKIIPETRKNEVSSLLHDGLTDISFSRPSKDISWGVPVPRDSSQTMYVWCDALTNYISALDYGTSDSEKFQKFWPADLHIIGKDILRFHAAIWPAMLISVGLSLPKKIFVHGHILVNGQKMSKSIGNVLDPFFFIQNFGADSLRYYFLREISVSEDGDFTNEKFAAAYAANLQNGIGNLVSRVIKMSENYFNGAVKKPSEEILASVPLTRDINFLSKKDYSHENDLTFFTLPYFINNYILPQYKEAMDGFELNKAADIIWSLISKMDKYIDEYKPFQLIKTNKEKTEAVIWSLLYGLSSLAKLLYPFIPETSDKISDLLGSEKNAEQKQEDFTVNFNNLKPLFPKIEIAL